MTRNATLVASCLVLASCVGQQSALDPASFEAERLTNLIIGFSTVLGVIWLAVMIAVGFAVRRRRAVLETPDVFATETDSGSVKLITVLAVATGLSLLVLTFVSFSSQRHVTSQPDAEVHVKITGHQWWWQVEYIDPQPSQRFETANELHVPVGARVTIDLDSRDVIHSFWVPNLTGKKDLIPGRPASLTFTANRTGTFRAQCAEFCGLQHAHMALSVTVEEKAAFDDWTTRQLNPANPYSDESAQRGRGVFESKACIMCHSIKGTSAGGRVGPDLTHFASRPTVAAGALPLTRGSLAAWMADPQGIKPGTEMPIVALEADELNALLDYLMSLK
jgi:cytochrome c oxidase subunit II